MPVKLKERVCIKAYNEFVVLKNKLYCLDSFVFTAVLTVLISFIIVDIVKGVTKKKLILLVSRYFHGG